MTDGAGALKYDATSIPAVYDRARDHGPEVLALWMNAVQATTLGRAPVASVLDLGCGTGRFSKGLADTFDCAVIGLDPSRRMLEQARAKRQGPRVRYCVARGEEMPLRPASCDLIFVSMVFHHFVEPERVARECRRVLRHGGVLFMRTGTADQAATYPYVPCFPESVPLLDAILPAAPRIRAVFEAAGFQTVRHELLVQQIAATHAEYLAKLEAGGDSVLIRLDPADLNAGLERFRAYSQRVDPQPVTEAIDCFVFE